MLACHAASSHWDAGYLQVRELEEEVEALQAGRAHRAKLMALMEKKALVGDLFNQLRLARAPRGQGPGNGPECFQKLAFTCTICIVSTYAQFSGGAPVMTSISLVHVIACQETGFSHL